MTSTNSSLLSTSLLKTNIFNERYFYTINRENFSKVSANVIFDAAFKKNIFTENSLYIIVGTDSGLLPKYIQQQGIPSGTRYLFIEPDKILSEIHQHQLLDQLNSAIICTTYNKWEAEAKNLKLEQYAYINSVYQLSAICAQQSSSEEYAELNWQISESLQTIHWKYSVRLSTEIFTIRQLENIAEQQYPAKVFENAFQGQTVIILAGGPSLTEILPWVKENRQNLVIFSVSRISRQLLKANITPDFVFSVDPQKVSFDVSHEMLLFDDQPILVHANHIFPGLLNQWQGSSLYMGQRLPWESKLNSDNQSSAGPTVTNSALLTALHFGFDTILLAGVDLCYTKSGITHAQGSVEQLAGPKYDTTSLQVETYSGESRGTGEDYSFALEVLAQQAQIIIKENKKVINLAPDAAKAEGIIHIPIEKIELTTYPETVRCIINKILKPDNYTGLVNEYHQNLIIELEKARHQIDIIERLAKKANKINATMYNSDGMIENYKDKKQLDKIEKTLNTKHRTFSILVKNFGIRQFLKITSPHDDDEWDAEQAKEIGKIYYDAYQNGAKALSLIINKAITRTKSRQEENKESPDFGLLLNCWEKDHSYRRAAFWKKNHPEIVLSEETEVAFESFAKKFIEYTSKADSEFKTGMEEGRSNLDFLKNKAKILFKNKRLDELKDLKENFLTDNKNKDKKEYLYLISAYIAELEHEFDSALTDYQQIINTDNTILLEDALNRITSISIDQQNHQNAFLALECLSQISPVYLPYYAESARITGDFMLAIDSYNAYINTFPEDVVAQLKLTNLYLSAEIYDAAEIMLEHILQKSPGLEAALVLKQQLANR